MSRAATYLPNMPGLLALPAIVLAATVLSATALAGPVENRVAVFAALDKITGDITTLRAPVNSEARFGTFRIRPRTCHTRPPTEEPRTMAFVEIEEHTYDKKRRRIFSGWMNAESPGLHAVEHPLFDVWLTGCAEPEQPAAQAPTASLPAGSAPPTPVIRRAGKGDVLSGDALPPAER